MTKTQRYDVRVQGSDYVTLAELNNDPVSHAEVVCTGGYDYQNETYADHIPVWINPDEIWQIERDQLARDIREARKDGWRFTRIDRTSNSPRSPRGTKEKMKKRGLLLQQIYEQKGDLLKLEKELANCK